MIQAHGQISRIEGLTINEDSVSFNNARITLNGEHIMDATTIPTSVFPITSIETDTSRRYEMVYQHHPHYEYVLGNSFSHNEQEEDDLVAYIARERERERENNRDIVERIFEMQHMFIRKYGIRPDALFINREDHYKLMRNTSYYHYDSTVTFQGLKIIPTLADETYVGLANINH
ncbi:hypothetical protein ACFX4N_24090 [Priestia sp. YIM B13551]|uniref:hypothetical protein n=1 Tax=Priestia sp. YIM B13551 TaxID=3366306 RepID=UPI00366EA823